MLRNEIARLRQNYAQSTLDVTDALPNAILQFEKWFDEAAAAQIFEHNAMTLATAKDNMPDARIVLLKSFSDNGFIFFTNYNSAKGQELQANPHAALVFLWKELERQVRIRGRVKKLDKALAEEYFYSRPIDSQCGAIASQQSSPIDTRQQLDAQFASVKQKSTDGEKLVMPDHWGGFCVEPIEIEFWQGRIGRMHDRLLYKKTENDWQIIRLQP